MHIFRCSRIHVALRRIICWFHRVYELYFVNIIINETSVYSLLRLNSLKHETDLNCMQRIGLCVTVNALRLRFKCKSTNSVKGSVLLLKVKNQCEGEKYFLLNLSVIWNTRTVCRTIQNFLLWLHVVKYDHCPWGG